MILLSHLSLWYIVLIFPNHPIGFCALIKRFFKPSLVEVIFKVLGDGVLKMLLYKKPTVSYINLNVQSEVLGVIKSS